jgi:hypothetical protein
MWGDNTYWMIFFAKPISIILYSKRNSIHDWWKTIIKQTNSFQHTVVGNTHAFLDVLFKKNDAAKQIVTPAKGCKFRNFFLHSHAYFRIMLFFVLCKMLWMI